MKINNNKINHYGSLYFSNFINCSIVVLHFWFFHTSEWSIPTGYGGDLYWVYQAKSYMNNEVFPLFLKKLNC